MKTTVKSVLGGLKQLNDEVLVPGDIVLTTATAAVSKGVRLITRSDISHAMVYVEDRSVIDATFEGVHARNTQRVFFEGHCSVHVLRLQTGISDAQLNAVITYLRGHIGTEYSIKEAMLTAIGGAHQWSKKQFCSRLVAQAFSSAGIQLVPDPNFCSPADLKESLFLSTVPNATLLVTAEEAVRWEGNEDVTQRMRDSINLVLRGARKKDKDIQTFDDLDRHLVNHPEQDDYFCRLLEKSGYLSVWKIEQEKNPWHYDLARMSTLPTDQIENYCWSVLQNERGGPNRYIVNRGGYLLFFRQYGLRFFGLMETLYEHLATLHRRRVDVAEMWLEDKGRFSRRVPLHLTPHTDEWFVALEQWDPPKAMMTRMVIEITGRTDVCSVCGDEPANDYFLAVEHQPTGGPNTLRLCDDCLHFRQTIGESFVPL